MPLPPATGRGSGAALARVPDARPLVVGRHAGLLALLPEDKVSVLVEAEGQLLVEQKNVARLGLEVVVATLAIVGHLVELELGIRQDVVNGSGGHRREPRVAGGLRRLPDVSRKQVVRPELGGIA